MATSDSSSTMFGAIKMGVDPGMSAALAQNWWAFLVRGIIAVLFALVAFFYPGVTMLSLVYVFAFYAVIDGVMSITAAVRAIQHHERWGLLVLEGIVSIVVAAIALASPAITVVAFVLLIAFWAILSGGLMFGAAFSLKMDHGRWWLIIGGLVSILYGVLLVIAPLIGAVVLTFWLGAYALIFGISLIVLSFQLRAKHGA